MFNYGKIFPEVYKKDFILSFVVMGNKIAIYMGNEKIKVIENTLENQEKLLKKMKEQYESLKKLNVLDKLQQQRDGLDTMVNIQVMSEYAYKSFSYYTIFLGILYLLSHTPNDELLYYLFIGGFSLTILSFGMETFSTFKVMFPKVKKEVLDEAIDDFKKMDFFFQNQELFDNEINVNSLDKLDNKELFMRVKKPV